MNEWKILKKLLECVICAALACLIVWYISGDSGSYYSRSAHIVVNDRAVIVLTLLEIAVYEMFLRRKAKTAEMNARIEQLEQQLKSIEKQN